jgi:putative chitinase
MVMPVDLLKLIESVAPQAKNNYLQAITQGGPLLDEADVLAPLRIAHFFAQALHETGGFTILRESMNYSADRLVEIFGINQSSASVSQEEATVLAHDEEAIAERVYGLGNPHMAQILGNTQPGDGYRYRGNGILQMTGRGAHKQIGIACALDFEADPDLATAPEHALKPALQEWSDKNLNPFADKDDIRTITLRINGGFNGFPQRQAWLDKLKQRLIASGDLTESTATGIADDNIKWLQGALNALGADPQLQVDGHLGPATTAAVMAFQATAGLTTDGIAGPVTVATVKLRLSARR